MNYSLAVTGPLGSGKTTFMKKLQAHLFSKTIDKESPNYNTYFAFNDLHKSTLFKRKFDSSFHSYSFQLSCMLNNYEQILRCESSHMKYVTDFWFGETLECYAMTYFAMGFITADQINSLSENNFNLLYNLPKPETILYIKYDSPKDLVDNILARGRYNESEESIEFLECFTTYLLEYFNLTMHNIQSILNIKVVEARPHELNDFIKNYCNEVVTTAPIIN